ncbi:LysE family transporter [Solidesulfovibrio sp. C21]|uniref:LysE family transporter n=1 Tax=Solidesulfovibrio sp. C21 TaxID=3398613 RepID=UPI0039FDB6D2
MPQTQASIALAAAALGLSAGLSPGPLLSLVLTQTLTHGPAEGVKVGLAPLITDAPIIIGAWLAVSAAHGAPTVLGLLSLAGACLLVRYGIECLQAPPPNAGKPDTAPKSLWRGVAANFTNPHPYLFWTTVGVPMLIEAARSGTAAVVTFLGVFYAAIVGAKSMAAVLAGRFRRFLGSRAYRLLMAVLGLSLFYFAFTFARDGLSLLGKA